MHAETLVPLCFTAAFARPRDRTPSAGAHYRRTFLVLIAIVSFVYARSYRGSEVGHRLSLRYAPRLTLLGHRCA